MSATQQPRRISPEESSSSSGSEASRRALVRDRSSEEVVHIAVDAVEGGVVEETQPHKRQRTGQRLEAESFAIDHMRCETSLQDLDQLRAMYHIPASVDLRLPGENNTPSHPPRGYVTLFLESFRWGVRLPLQSYFARVLSQLRLAPGQLNPNGWRVLFGLYVLWRWCNLGEPAVDEIKHLYQLKSSPKDAG